MPTTGTTPSPKIARPLCPRELLALVRPFGPGVEGDALVFDRDPPDEWAGALSVLHTGVRAQLAGKRWCGCGSDRATAAPRPLNPSAPIPPGITLLCVEGDDRWDPIDPLARLDHPGLFDPAAGPSRRRGGRPPPGEQAHRVNEA
ncbi:MAG: hypothetical protein K2X87_18160 [Gemmataceae bacterium]|nr:hypothetical protein [Gemmataceae bacterium]